MRRPVRLPGPGAPTGTIAVMHLDTTLDFDPTGRWDAAAAAEADGYSAAWVTEVGHDPLAMLAGAAGRTTSLALGTSIVVAFGRSPLITATQANDVQILSRGRLLLGLGSQIKPHIEKRYSMPWSRPAARMREYVLALRAIWAAWNEGATLNFRGEFYRHTLMTPFFSPAPHPYGAPKVFVAAVGEAMTEVAGEVADGLLVHPFTTVAYLREVTLPALERGLARSGRGRDEIEISLSGFVASGEPGELDQVRHAVREQIAFYASTLAYRGVLASVGRDDLQAPLAALARRGAWAEMGDLIDDEVLESVAVTGAPAVVAAGIQERYASLVDRFSVYPLGAMTSAARRQVVAGWRAW